MSAWGDAWGDSWGDSWGVRVIVYTQARGGGGGVRRRQIETSDKRKLEKLMRQIERDDEEVLAVIIEVVRLGVLG